MALLFHVIPFYQMAHINAVHVAVGITYKVLPKGHVSEKRTLRGMKFGTAFLTD